MNTATQVLLKITERGNGFPSVGENVYASDTDTVYALTADQGSIHTGSCGEGNYCYMLAEESGDASDLSQEEFDDLREVGVQVEKETHYSDVVTLETENLDETTLVVNDGCYHWLADKAQYEAAMARLVTTDRSGSDESEAEYYSDFCNICRSLDRTSPDRAEKAKALYLEIHGSQPNWS